MESKVAAFFFFFCKKPFFFFKVKFLIKDMMFRLHDVGGQRSDRRKWLTLFDCVHAVIFCVEATSYLRFKNNSNVLMDSLALFSAIVNSKIFIDAAMIAFLAKIDIFQVPQCDNFKIFLSFRFYVKSILKDLEAIKLPFLQFKGF